MQPQPLVRTVQPDTKSCRRIHAAVPPAERALVLQAAARRNMSVSRFVRMATLRAARRTIRP
jgi:uncharacterized protein (DUF1778 family)